MKNIISKKIIKYYDLLAVLNYTLNWIHKDCPKYDKIHVRTMLEIALEKALNRTEGK